ncbi:hypothetical protein [Mesorhizobium sp.]|uniref:hypothetical protein n=1 Tax=Mesorhizobium sp. TaxID=1871066 RepID=UPI001228E3C4|nr:hypothetical protein [Mesorhizobium sp.]TIV60822.1 MAG: hypothetical protein E5V80_07610 [Mesorhizobium sp.]
MAKSPKSSSKLPGSASKKSAMAAKDGKEQRPKGAGKFDTQIATIKDAIGKGGLDESQLMDLLLHSASALALKRSNALVPDKEAVPSPQGCYIGDIGSDDVTIYKNGRPDRSSTVQECARLGILPCG